MQCASCLYLMPHSVSGLFWFVRSNPAGAAQPVIMKNEAVEISRIALSLKGDVPRGTTRGMEVQFFETAAVP
jgi:hypothetical protein